MIPAGYIALVIGREQQAFAALALVGPYVADICDLPVPEVGNDSENAWRDVDDQRPTFGIEP